MATLPLRRKERHIESSGIGLMTTFSGMHILPTTADVITSATFHDQGRTLRQFAAVRCGLCWVEHRGFARTRQAQLGVAPEPEVRYLYKLHVRAPCEPSRKLLTQLLLQTHDPISALSLVLSLSSLTHPPASVAAVAVGLGPSSRCTKQAVGTPRGNGGSSIELILAVLRSNTNRWTVADHLLPGGCCLSPKQFILCLLRHYAAGGALGNCCPSVGATG